MLMCKQEVQDERACDIMEMKSILSDNTTLEPIMRVAFSKSGTSQVTNSHASTENVQKNSACANHTDIAN